MSGRTAGRLAPRMTPTAVLLQPGLDLTGPSRALAIAAVVGCGANGGVLFAFSSFVMPGLRRLTAPQGIAAMQSINVTAVTPAFMTLLFGSAGVCAVSAVAALRHGVDRTDALVLLGAMLFLVGTIGLTAGFHVPMNDHLATLDPSTTDAAAYWSHYVRRWTWGNHVRTTASLGACACYLAALLRRS